MQPRTASCGSGTGALARARTAGGWRSTGGPAAARPGTWRGPARRGPACTSRGPDPDELVVDEVGQQRGTGQAGDDQQPPAAADQQVDRAPRAGAAARRATGRATTPPRVAPEPAERDGGAHQEGDREGSGDRRAHPRRARCGAWDGRGGGLAADGEGLGERSVGAWVTTGVRTRIRRPGRAAGGSSSSCWGAPGESTARCRRVGPAGPAGTSVTPSIGYRGSFPRRSARESQSAATAVEPTRGTGRQAQPAADRFRLSCRGAPPGGVQHRVGALDVDQFGVRARAGRPGRGRRPGPRRRARRWRAGGRS